MRYMTTIYYEGTEPTFQQIQNVEEALEYTVELAIVLCDKPAINVYSDRKPRTTAKAVAELLDLNVTEIAS